MKHFSLIIITFCIFLKAHAEDSALPVLKCTVVNSSGTFSSFIQTYEGDTITIDLKNLAALVEREVIRFDNRAYITLQGMPELEVRPIFRGSHDSGGWEIYSETEHRTFKISIFKRSMVAWIQYGDISASSPLSMASMNCTPL